MDLTNEALKAIDDPQVKLSTVIRMVIRVADLRNDFKNLTWLRLEMHSMTEKDQMKWREVIDDVKPHFLPDMFTKNKLNWLKNYRVEREFHNLENNLKPKEQPDITTLSVPEIELRIETTESLLQLAIPKGISEDAAYLEYKRTEKSRFDAAFTVKEIKSVLERIRQRVYEFLNQIEKELSYGQVQSSIFEENRLFVDKKLSKLCPEAIRKFSSVYQRLKSADEEDWSQALTSCRRILKDFANVVYPPTHKPIKCSNGKKHVLGEDKYINRLWQFVYEKVGSETTKKVLKGQTDYLGERIDALYKLTNKGVHDQVNKFDVNQCVIYTYLLLGDLLRI